jgi:hypothetical protein
MKTATTTAIAMISVAVLTLQARPATGGQAGNGLVERKNLNVFPEHLHSARGILSGGWLLKTATTYVDSNGWVYSGATNHLYYQYGNAASSVIQIWKNGAWVNSNLDSITYDASGHQTTSLEMSWFNGAWELGVQDTFMYGVNGYKASALERTWNGTGWANSTYDSYTNDASGRPTVDVNQQWNGSAWVNVNRLSYTYNEYEGQTYALWETWSGSAWVNHGQEFVTFGANEEKSNVLQQVWKNGTWVNYTQDNYTYDANGHQTLDVSQNWSSGAWVNYIQWTSTIDTNGNKSDDVEQDWYKNSWRNSEWIHSTWERVGAITVVAPVQGETILAGSFYEIQWHAPGSTAVDIDLTLDSARTFHTIAYNVPAENTYAWQVPDTLSAKCRIRIRDADDSTKNGQSNQFRIKPYILTRFKADGDYEAFDPKIHGWQFRNDSATMWPYKWWDQFNYRSGTDPYTAQRYDSVFVQITRPQFPDWPLFVRAFGVPNCYPNMSPVVYSARAFWYWRPIISVWGGSCFGFSASSLINFDFPDYFKATYAVLGNFSQLHDLSINDSTRLIVNLNYTYWFGYVNQRYFNMQGHKTPVQTLQDLKTMFMSTTGNHQSLYLRDVASSDAHSVVPYALKRDPGTTGRVRVFVYDNNCPDGDCGNGITNPFVLIDSVNNLWYYLPQHWPSKDTILPDYGLFLESPANTFLNSPILPLNESPVQTPPVRSPFGVGQAYVLVFSSPGAAVSITDAASETIGFHDSVVVNTFSSGTPIIPPTSQFTPPLGYFLPNQSYAIRLNSFLDTLSRLSVLDTLRVFSYWRTDAQKGQSDNLSYSDGIAVGNPDPQAKDINLEAVLTLPASERTTSISDCSLMQSDSVRMSTPDSGQVKLVNLGSQKTYDLDVRVGGPGIAGKYRHGGITVPAHSTHYILPYWPDLHQPLRIMEDVGNTGKVSDTLTLTDQSTGVNGPTRTVPGAFALEQNYPNPFNPSTTIRYQVPVAGVVKIVVYDILGREVSVLVNEMKNAGAYEVRFDGSGLASGVYLYRIEAGNFVQTKKMLVVK